MYEKKKLPPSQQLQGRNHTTLGARLEVDAALVRCLQYFLNFPSSPKVK